MGESTINNHPDVLYIWANKTYFQKIKSKWTLKSIYPNMDVNFCSYLLSHNIFNEINSYEVRL